MGKMIVSGDLFNQRLICKCGFVMRKLPGGGTGRLSEKGLTRLKQANDEMDHSDGSSSLGCA